MHILGRCETVVEKADLASTMSCVDDKHRIDITTYSVASMSCCLYLFEDA